METLLGWFREYPAESITPQDIERRFEHEQWSPATVNRHRALLSLTHRLAIRNGKIKENPARLVRYRLEDNARIRFLSPEEEVRLRKAIEAPCLERIAELELASNTGTSLERTIPDRLGRWRWLLWNRWRSVQTAQNSFAGELRSLADGSSLS